VALSVCPSWLSAIAFEQFCQLALDLAWFGKAGHFGLGEEVAGAEGDFEDATATGNQVDTAREMLRVIVEDAFRQTGGFLDVSSRGAVLDAHLSRGFMVGHRWLLSRP
jgi:hypothetical protein